MNELSLDIKNVSAAYGRGTRRTQALTEVSVAVTRGEIFGLLGPNGAGKTTLLACVEGLHRPEAGTVRVGGVDVQADPAAAKRKLGIQLQKTALLDDLTVAELVEVYSALYEVYLTPAQFTRLLAGFDLDDLRQRLARRLSGGQQQRLALALAVANDPEVVLLDEPTAALDPHARRGVWDIIRRLHDEGRTVLITTHAMEEAEALCGRVAIIDHGRIIACDSPARLVAGLGAGPVLKTAVDLPLDQVRGLAGVCGARYTGQHLEMETSDPQAALAALQVLAARLGRSLNEVSLRQPNLEDVFLRLTGRPLGTEGLA
jgi:ABC-2 type transport system ATP-binding protein